MDAPFFFRVSADSGRALRIRPENPEIPECLSADWQCDKMPRYLATK